VGIVTLVYGQWVSVNTPLSRIGDEPYTLGLFDTSGQEEFPRVRPLAYPKTDVFLVFARIGMESTHRNIETMWIPEMTHHCPGVPFIIVGVESPEHDDDDDRYQRARESKLSGDHSACTAMGEDLAKRFGAERYMECNIFTQEGLKDVFDWVRSLALGRRDSPRTTDTDS
jgi:cell division control protein 42